MCSLFLFLFFFFNDPATTEIYTLSLHDALPIYLIEGLGLRRGVTHAEFLKAHADGQFYFIDRKSTRLNSSHVEISYAVFCLKKKKNIRIPLNKNIDHEDEPTTKSNEEPITLRIN